MSADQLPHSPLAAHEQGDGPLVTLVHGFAQTRHCWGPLGEALGRRFRCRFVDAPGHGDSSEVEADLWATGRLLRTLAAGGAIVGYSMGARMALHAALLDAAASVLTGRPRTEPDGTAHEPDRAAPRPGLRGLVLISGTAGIDDPDERAARRASDEDLAAHLEAVGVERFVDEWLAGPLFQQLPTWARFDEERGGNTASGLARSLRTAGTGTQEPLWDRLGEVRLPTLVVTGALDEKFTTLGRRLASSLPAGRHVVVDGAGHSAHLEQPDRVAEVVVAFLAEVLGPGPGR